MSDEQKLADAIVREKWEAHTGLDYSVVMLLPDECTDNASIRVMGPQAESLSRVIAAALNEHQRRR